VQAAPGAASLRHAALQQYCLDGRRRFVSKFVGSRRHGFGMRSGVHSPASMRVLVVEDELMIRMLLQDMLDDLGHTLAGEAGRLDEALALAKQADFDIAILDVNLNGQPISPVVEVLIARGLPFVFATGYGQRGVPEPYRMIPTLQKPFQADALALALEAAVPAGRN
jgi:CheY-like chemotaxis protein